MSDWTDTDKQLHAAGGFIAGAATVCVLDYIAPELSPTERAIAALIPVVLLAVAKEVIDHQDPDNHTSDWKDAAATVAGGALAITVTWKF